jgi:tartrate dehydratase beta subunit/fumarate hydratase class I family protein
VLAAEKITDVSQVYWLEELGMPEAVWILEVKEFGPLVVAMDSFGRTLYKHA